MIIVTGGAGFIGSNIIKELNKQQHTNILVVDNLTNHNKYANLLNLKISDYIDKKDFIKIITSKNKIKNIKTIFHQGACSNTTIKNGQYMIKNNYQYSKKILHFCMKNKIPFLYASSASVYGNQKIFIENQKYENPLNIYGYSKFLFDQYVRTVLKDSQSQIFGARYFNVYGPGETHKGTMASIVLQIINQINNNKNITLFSGSKNFFRDFIYIQDIIKVNIWAWKNSLSGIFNIGTGVSESFTNIAYTTQQLYNYNYKKTIQYVDFPPQLKKSYQTFTKANIANLKLAGYNKEFTTTREGIKKYILWVKQNNK